MQNRLGENHIPADQPAGGLSESTGSRRMSFWRVLGSVLSLGLFIYLISTQGWDEFYEAFSRVPWLSFLAALGLLLISRVFVTLRWYALLRSAHVNISFWHCFRLMFMGNFSSNFLPSTVGGDLVRWAGAVNLKVDAGVSAASLVLDRLVGMAGMSSLAPFGLAIILRPAGLGIVTAAGVFPGLVRLPGVRWATKRLDAFARNLVRSSIYWLRHPTGLFLALLATYGHMLFTFFMISLLLSGMHQSLSLGWIGALWSLSYFVTLIPISFNGLGLQELSITYLYSHFGGITSESALALAVLTRLLFLLACLPGALFLPDILRPFPKAPQSKTP